MRVFVTGAAGFLGTAVCRHLKNNGDEVYGVDLQRPADQDFVTTVMDLRHCKEVYAAVKDCEAVVHLANSTQKTSGSCPQKMYSDNSAMNANVFQAAVETGIRKLIYASSTQIFAGTRRGNEPHRPSVLPYLPLDENLPPCPGNAYAASKEAGEALLRYHSRWNAELGCTAIRWPLLVTQEKVNYFRERKPAEKPDPKNLLDVGFSFLEVNDAADLVNAVLRSNQTGYKQYFPAAEQNRLGWSIAEIIKHFYPHVPLHIPIQEMHNIVNISSITENVNWGPVNSSLDID